MAKLRHAALALLAGYMLTGAALPPDRLCALPEGWDQIEAQDPAFVIFGELHGTREAPAFVGETLCALAARRRNVLLAVELDVWANAALQAAWALPHAQFPEALRKGGWAGRDDGVASEAMFALLVRLHALKDGRLPVSIAAFNGRKDEEQRARFAHLPGQGSHEAAQAENIRDAARAAGADLTVVIVGNLHAQKRPVTIRDMTFEPMAMQLGKTERVVSLQMRSAGGTAWNCRPRPGYEPKYGEPVSAGGIVCAAQPVGPYPDLHHKPYVALGAIPGEKTAGLYDGYFWLGPITASPPAVAKR